MSPDGLEPSTPSLKGRCSTNWAKGPKLCSFIYLSNKFQIIGYIDKKKNKENIFNLDYLGDDNQLPELRKISKNAFISIGQIKDNKPRRFWNLLKFKWKKKPS